MASGLEALIKKQFGIQAFLDKGHDGIFEVSVNGEQLYTNNKKCNTFPETMDVLLKLEKMGAVPKRPFLVKNHKPLSIEGAACTLPIQEVNLSTLPVHTNSSSSDCSSGSCCDGPTIAPEILQAPPIPIKIIIDGTEIEATSHDTNLVDAADKAGIRIPAPCYRGKKKGTCCKACAVEIDGEQHYACGTQPRNGMNIIVNRDDLKAIRRKRLLEYGDTIKNSNSSNCGCGV